MRPEKLVMENFGPFSGRAELDFSKLEDLFLITGQTGAGKTTVFDALCFALYGKVPGSRGEHPARLRSDHAAEDSGCFVSLEFSLGDKRYLAERSPRQERKKKRGEGTISMEETLAFFEIVGGLKTRPVSKKSEGDAKIKELIGLEAEEFFKIVLLPQGEFAEFLQQNTNERQKVLGKLFPVEKAVRVKELARKKAGDAEARTEGAARLLEDLGKRVSAETYEKAYAEASAILEAAAEKSRGLEQEEALLGRILILRRNEKEAEKRLEDSRGLLAETIAAEASVNEKNARLSRSRAARLLEPYLRDMRTAAENFNEAEAALASAGEEKEAAEKAAAEAETLKLLAPALENEVRLLLEKRSALAEMLEQEENLKADEEELRLQDARIKELRKKAGLLSEELEKQDAFIEETEALAAEQTGVEEELELSKSIKDIFLEFRKCRERADELENERALAEKEIAELGFQTADYEKRIPVMEAEIKKLKDEKTRREQADMAAHLSAFLEPGKPCPVCGSTGHPSPASGKEAPFDFDERIYAQEASLIDAEKNKSAAKEKLEARKRDAIKIRDSLSLLEKEMREARQGITLPPDYPANPEALAYLQAGLPSGKTIDRIIRLEAETLNKILDRQKNSRDAAGRIKELYRQRAEAQNDLGEIEKELAAADEQKKNLSRKIAEGREKRRILLSSADLPDDNFTGALAALDDLVAEKENLITRYREEREQAVLRLSGAKAAWEGAFRNRGGVASRLEDARASLAQAVSSTDFPAPEDAEKALLDPNDELILEKEIRLWRESRAGLDTQIAEQEKQLQGVRLEIADTFPGEILSPEKDPGKIPSLEEAGSRRDVVREERMSAEEEKNQAFSTLKGLEKDLEALEEAQKSYNTLAADAAKFRALSDDLSGRNPRKLPFDSWLLGNYLEEAAAFATARLEKMSESRYSLLLDTERRQNRGYAGLDLMVFDAHTGKTRPCATLSGGESFMASISLALGLADSIQNRSGGVKLDAVFIDEGFGSLDDTSLDKALVILDELRERRMVGLISHVGELRSRIPCQVELIKTSAGSRIEPRTN